MERRKPSSVIGRVNLVFTAAAAVIALLLTVKYLAVYIFVGSMKPLMCFGACLLWLLLLAFLLYKGACRHNFALVILEAFAILFWLMLLTAYSPMVNSDSMWRYTFQRKYISGYGKTSCDYMPDTLPEGISDYRFFYRPTIMQGTGNNFLRFVADDALVDEYISEYSKEAIYTRPLSDFKRDCIIFIDKVSPKAESISDTFEGRALALRYDEKFWGDDVDNATVFFTYAYHNFNHPSSSAVIIDKNTNKVEFAHFGG